MDDIAIKVDHVSKTFRLPHEKQNSVKGTLIHLVKGGKRTYEKQQVLKDISFEIKKGEFFGIVGRNGSGKSTLLKLLAGIYEVDKGQIQVNGKLTPFIELGVGFNVELTGRENVFLNGALLGFNREEMTAMYDSIVEFAELDKFMDQKLKNYSSGMQVRLAFSIAIRAKTDILLIDEVLAVGDANFQLKCQEYFREIKNSDKTVVFVSHDRSSVQQFCDRAILIESGVLVESGSTGKVLERYNDITLEQLSNETDFVEGAEDEKKLSHQIQIVSTNFDASNTKNTFKPNEKIVLTVEMKVNEDVEHPIFGFILKRRNEAPIFGTNTRAQNIATRTYKKGEVIKIRYTFNNVFNNGKYYISPAVASEDGAVFYDWKDEYKAFFVNGWTDIGVSVNIPHEIAILDGEHDE